MSEFSHYRFLNHWRKFKRANGGWGAQKELAESAGLSRSIVSETISGKRVPGMAAVAKFARAFGCKKDDLLRRVW